MHNIINPISSDMDFSNKERDKRIARAVDQTYDLIIIGGGITGAGIALDAASRGIKTLLLEKRDFASGTSSKSTKLIHGGLRYLKQLEFGLVRETGQERAVAHHNAPHLVHPETMLLPIVRGGEFSKFSASMAISVYDFLANVPSKDRKKALSKEATLKVEPLLNRDLLKSGVAYSEYRTDDARLTIELIKAARREGAEAINYLKVEAFKLSVTGNISGVVAQDELTGTNHCFMAKHVVSAAGPWVDILRREDHSLKGKSLHLTKGVHIVLSHERLPLNHSVYFDAFDGRMIFAIPRGKVTYVGTSDTNYRENLDRVLCTKEDVDYLLEKTNTIFCVPELKQSDVISSWAGLRPLIHEDGKSPSELSRKDEIFISDSGLISIAGGKLTGYRKMAERLVDLLQQKDKQLPQQSCKTKTYRIHAQPFANYHAFQEYCNKLVSSYQDKGLTDFDSWYLTSTYGQHATAIVERALTYTGLSLVQAIIKAEIDYVIQYESAVCPDDYFNRRSGKLYFDIESLSEHFDFIIDTFADHYHWDGDKLAAEKVRCRQLIDDCVLIA
jgi:glycerol-3-phosphate dehydrogenase